MRYPPGAMRASRLVSVLLLLQSRGGQTAAELARELEVSVRTIHRDVDALSASGVPIYADRGPHGGIRLVDGYRTRLTGMTADEAEGLFLAGLPGPAAELGLGTVVAAARLKVLAALPTELRGRASRLVERFHLDAAAWYHADESVPHLGSLSEAVWESQRVQIGYDRGDKTVDRILEPLGLVLKAGVWYLIAAADGQPRTYRVSRVTQRDRRSMSSSSGRRRFDLAAFWAESSAAYERDTPRVEVVAPGRSRPDGSPAWCHRRAAVRHARASRRARSRRLAAHPGEAWIGRTRRRRRSSPSGPAASCSSRSRSAVGSQKRRAASPLSTTKDRGAEASTAGGRVRRRRSASPRWEWARPAKPARRPSRRRLAADSAWLERATSEATTMVVVDPASSFGRSRRDSRFRRSISRSRSAFRTDISDSERYI